MMKPIFTIGRIFFFAAMAFFGLQHLIYATSPKHALIGPPWIPVSSPFAFVAGCVLVVACLVSVTNRYMQLMGILLASVLLSRVLLVSAPAVVAEIHNGGKWASACELLAMCGGSLFLVGALSAGRSEAQRSNDMLRWTMMLGSALYGTTLLVFGIEHFVYAHYLATLVPGWIPWRLFWAYFVGVAFVAAAVAILTRKNARIGAFLLGTMFFSWVVLVHSPRVVAAAHDGNEWTSAFVALAMSGAAWMLTAIETPPRLLPASQEKN